MEQETADPRNPKSTAKIFGHPIHPMLIHFPIAVFTGALLTDIAYARSANIQWANFSIWLITAGLVMTGLAMVAGLVDYLAERRIRSLRIATIHMLLGMSVFVIELVNAFVHSRDGWTSVVPTGLALSAIAVILMMGGAWLGGLLVYRHRVGVQ